MKENAPNHFLESMEKARTAIQQWHGNLLATNFLFVIGAVTLLIAALWFCFPRPSARTWLFGGTDRRNIGRAEGFAMRFLFAYVVWISFFWKVGYKTVNPDELSGLAHFMDVTVFAHPGMETLMFWLVGVALVVYVMGCETAMSLTVVTIFHCAYRALNNSQGFDHHGFQIIGLVLIAHTIAAWATVLTRWVSDLRSRPAPQWAASGNWTWYWYLSLVFISASYFMTAVTKQKESRGKWLGNSHYIATQIVKTHRQNYYKNLEEEYTKGVAPAALDTPDPDNDRYRMNVPAQAEWMRANPFWTRLIFGAGFAFEALAFLAILNRWSGMALGVTVVAFHLSVEWLMQLHFEWNRHLAFIFLINLPGLLILCLKKWTARPPLAGEGVGDPLPVSDPLPVTESPAA